MIPYAKIAIIAGIALSAAGLAWKIQDWRHGAEVAELESSHARAMQELAEKSRLELERLQNEVNAKAKEIARIDLARAQEVIRHEAAENDLRYAIHTERKRLHIGANCPAATSVPGTTDSTGVDAPGQAELDDSAREAYFDLRRGIIETEAELRACKRIAITLTEQLNAAKR